MPVPKVNAEAKLIRSTEGYLASAISLAHSHKRLFTLSTSKNSRLSVLSLAKYVIFQSTMIADKYWTLEMKACLLGSSISVITNSFREVIKRCYSWYQISNSHPTTSRGTSDEKSHPKLLRLKRTQLQAPNQHHRFNCDLSQYLSELFVPWTPPIRNVKVLWVVWNDSLFHLKLSTTLQANKRFLTFFPSPKITFHGYYSSELKICQSLQ